MRIGIIGAGKIGATTARLFAGAGHAVILSNSRGPDSLDGVLAATGPGVQAATVEEAASRGEVVLVAIPFGRYPELPAAALADKIVVDATNYYPRRDGEIDLQGHGSSVVLARSLPGARVVKAFNTMFFETLGSAGQPQPEGRLVLFVAGDDAVAKATVSRLIEEIGFAPLDTGPLDAGGRRQEPDSPLYNRPMTLEQATAELGRLTSGSGA